MGNIIDINNLSVFKQNCDNIYAQKDGNYPDMSVGFADKADNLKAEEITVTTGYTLKATAHDPAQPELEVTDGLVTMKSLAGRVMAWNQLAKTSVSGVAVYRMPFDIDNSEGSGAKFTYIYNSDDGIILEGSFIQGHKYYVKNDIEFTSEDTFASFYDANLQSLGFSLSVGSRIGTSTQTGTCNGLRVSGLPAGKHISGYITLNVHDLTLMFGAGNEPSTVEEFEAYLATCKTPKPYWQYNPGQLVGARMLGWNLPETKNLLNPTTKQAELFAYTYAEHDNEYTVIGWDELTGAALQFTPFNTGVAEAVTLDANNRFVIPSAGILEVVEAVSGVAIVGDVSRVCVNATYDGTEDGEGADYKLDANEFDSANIYHLDNGVYTQVFDGGVMKATGDGVDDVRDEVGYDEATKKCWVRKPVGDVDLGTLDWLKGGQNRFQANINDFVIGTNGVLPKIICSKYATLTMGDTYAQKTGISDNNDVKPQVCVYDPAYASGTADAFKMAVNGVHLFYELATPGVYTSDLYYKTGENTYIPLEDVFPIIGKCCNWASEKLVEQADDVNGQPQSITPITTEDFTTNYKELLKTIGDTYISKEELKQTTGDSTKIPMSQKAVSDALALKEDSSNKVTSLSSSSTDTEYPSAKAVYDFVTDTLGDIETLLAAI